MRPYETVIALLLLAMTACLPACRQEVKEEAPPQPWTFESKTAPYRLQLPGTWTSEESERLNSHADLAVSRDEILFLIVIPQELPKIQNIAPPDALALKRASVGLMEERIDDFEIDRQGPIRLDGREGHTVFARGLVDDQKVKYITTYVTDGDWGYQVVAWGPEAHERALLAEVDQILTKWKFDTPAKPEPVPSIKTPGGTDAGPDAK